MAWYHRLLNVIRPGRLARSIDREIEFHLAEREDELVAGGMRAAEARRQARRQFGNPEVQRERTRDVDVVVWLESVVADMRYAVRALRRSPGFTLVAVLSLGLGIGATTAIFSLVNAVLLRSLSVDRPGELVQVTRDGGNGSFTNPLWETIREERGGALAGVFAYGPRGFDLATGGEGRWVRGNWVSGDFFAVLGVRPVAGRLLVRADDYRGCPAVAVLSHGLWQREYGGAPETMGGTISLNGHAFEIVGVSDPAFSGLDVGSPVEVYAPLCAEAILAGSSSALDRRSAWFLRIMGRLGAEETPAQAGSRLASVAPTVFSVTVPEDWDPEAQRRYLAGTLDVRAARGGLSGLRDQYRDALVILMAVVSVVLLIACANVANLLLARATGRQHELAVRRAIGSGRSRLIRQLMTESLVLSFIGAAVGVLFARWASRLMVALLSSSGRIVWLDLSLDLRMLAFTAAVATTTGLIFGLAPAWRSASVTPQAALRRGARGIAEGGGRFAAGRALVVGQLSLSLVLLMAAGLLARSLHGLITLDPGFSGEGVLVLHTDLRNAGYAPDALRGVESELVVRLRALPGVRSASAAMVTPLDGVTWNNQVIVDGYERPDREDGLVYLNTVSDGYFMTVGTALVAGRDFDPRDREGAPLVAVINQTMALRFFGELKPLGRRFRLDSAVTPTPEIEVVGVVENSKYESLSESDLPIAYFPLGQGELFGPTVTFIVRAAGFTAVIIPAIKAVMADAHPAISFDVATLSDQVAASLARPRLLAALSGFFGAVALLLAMIGLYGTLSNAVTSRRREIGVRLALGAAPIGVLRMVLGEVGRLVVVGIVLGVAATLASSRLLSAFLFGVTPNDPATLGMSAGALVGIALAAGALPALRAARLDPMVVLRED